MLSRLHAQIALFYSSQRSIEQLADRLMHQGDDRSDEHRDLDAPQQINPISLDAIELEVMARPLHWMTAQRRAAFDQVRSALQRSEAKFGRIHTSPDAIAIELESFIWEEMNEDFKGDRGNAKIECKFFIFNARNSFVPIGDRLVQPG